MCTKGTWAFGLLVDNGRTMDLLKSQALWDYTKCCLSSNPEKRSSAGEGNAEAQVPEMANCCLRRYRRHILLRCTAHPWRTIYSRLRKPLAWMADREAHKSTEGIAQAINWRRLRGNAK